MTTEDREQEQTAPGGDLPPAPSPSPGGYLDAAGQGRSGAGRYLLGTVLVLLYWQVLGAVVALAIARAFSPPGTDLSAIADDLSRPSAFGPLRGFILVNAVHPFLLLGLFLVVTGIHRRPLRTLVTAEPRVRLGRILEGFAVWFALSALASGIDLILAPDSFRFRWDPAASGTFLLLALALTPIQTTAEELFFRGYLMQGLSLVSRRRIFLAGVSGLLFALPHLANPEMEIDPVLLPLTYFAIGVLLALLALRDGRLELAIGAHAANNLFGATIVSFEGSIFTTPSLFFTTQYDPLGSLLGLLVMAAIFYAVFFARADFGGRRRPE